MAERRDVKRINEYCVNGKWDDLQCKQGDEDGSVGRARKQAELWKIQVQQLHQGTAKQTATQKKPQRDLSNSCHGEGMN